MKKRIISNCTREEFDARVREIESAHREKRKPRRTPEQERQQAPHYGLHLRIAQHQQRLETLDNEFDRQIEQAAIDGYKAEIAEAETEAERQQAKLIAAGAELNWTAERSQKFAGALQNWITEGKPTRSDEEMDEAIIIHESCENRNGDKCGGKGNCKTLVKHMPVREAARMVTVVCPAMRW